jgi:calcineurin-like phosphoesterase family protein
MKNYWFSSDFHLGHVNVLKYDKRGFKNVEEMNNTIINNHNSVVAPDDDFYFLGDFSFDDRHTEEWIKQLNGNKFFIKGNHDHHTTRKLYSKYGTYLGEFYDGRIDGYAITLCHYAMRVWNKSHHGAIHLYGHSHGTLPDDQHSLSTDVGIMLNDYYPFNMNDIETIMSNKLFKPVDHHDRRK